MNDKKEPVYCKACTHYESRKGCLLLFNVETGELGAVPTDLIEGMFCSDFSLKPCLL